MLHRPIGTVRATRVEQRDRRGGWFDAELIAEHTPAFGQRTRRGAAITGCQMGADEKSVGALAVRVDVDRLGGISCGERRVAVLDPRLGEALQGAQPDLRESTSDAVQPVALLAGQDGSGPDRPSGERPARGLAEVAGRESDLRPVDRVGGGIQVQPRPRGQLQRIRAVGVRDRTRQADAPQRPPELADERPHRDVPRRRPGRTPQVVCQIGVGDGFVERGQPDEEPAGLTTGEIALANGRSDRSGDRNAARQVDPDARRRRRIGRQRFANHAAQYRRHP